MLVFQNEDLIFFLNKKQQQLHCCAYLFFLSSGFLLPLWYISWVDVFILHGFGPHEKYVYLRLFPACAQRRDADK